MITSFDPEYQVTKEIKQGKRNATEISQRLIEWVNDQYHVHAINAYFDTMIHDNRPRVQLIFENYEDVSKFRDKGVGNYLPDLQDAIANKYVELVSELKLQDYYSTSRVFVCYSEFSSIYRSEIYKSVPQTELESLFNKYTNELVWQIQVYGSGLVIFFFSNLEKNNPNNDSLIENLKNEYFSLIKPYDEFDYLERTWMKRESKEDFENIYKGNWFYWSKDH